MKYKIGRGLMAVAVIAGCMVLASPASALDTSSPEFLGVVNDGIPSSLAAEAGYITTLVGLAAPSGPTLVGTETYTRSANTPAGCCPAATATGAVGSVGENPPNTVDVTGFTYLLGKYDAAQAGSLVWYVGNLTGVQTIPTNFGTCGSSGCGLSHWSLFNPGTTQVPEPATLLLLGSGLVAAGLFARKRQV